VVVEPRAEELMRASRSPNMLFAEKNRCGIKPKDVLWCVIAKL